MQMQFYGLLLIGILIGVVGQLLLKYGMSRQPGFRLCDLATLTHNVPVICGFCCYGLSTVLYLTVLARLELSLAYPTVSLGYVLVIIMSRVVFNIGRHSSYLTVPLMPSRYNYDRSAEVCHAREGAD